MGLAFPPLCLSLYGSSLPTSPSFSLPLSPHCALTPTNGQTDLAQGLCLRCRTFPKSPRLSPLSGFTPVSSEEAPLAQVSHSQLYCLTQHLSLPGPFCLIIACGRYWNLGQSRHIGCSVPCRVNHWGFGCDIRHNISPWRTKEQSKHKQRTSCGQRQKCSTILKTSF